MFNIKATVAGCETQYVFMKNTADDVMEKYPATKTFSVLVNTPSKTKFFVRPISIGNILVDKQEVTVTVCGTETIANAVENTPVAIELTQEETTVDGKYQFVFDRAFVETAWKATTTDAKTDAECGKNFSFEVKTKSDLASPDWNDPTIVFDKTKGTITVDTENEFATKTLIVKPYTKGGVTTSGFKGFAVTVKAFDCEKSQYAINT